VLCRSVIHYHIPLSFHMPYFQGADSIDASHSIFYDVHGNLHNYGVGDSPSTKVPLAI
jgi:hypothetical protein